MPEEKKVQPEIEVSREEAQLNYLKSIGQEVEPEQQEAAPVEAEVKPEEKPVEKIEDKEEPKKEEVKPEKKEEKYVPYDALHAERIKRKAEAEARKAAEARAADLEARIKQYQAQDPQEAITDYDKELMELKRRQKAIEDMEADRIEREKHENAEKLTQDIKNKLIQTNEDLEKEGYPGFQFMKSSVAEELQRLVDEDELNSSLDNPSGWKKIYKERIFPTVASKFESAIKSKTLEDKIALKEKAGLVTSTGKAEPKPKDPDSKTEDELRREYVAMRRSRFGE
jgi:small-conductance mechanosensitive channel